MSPDRLLATFDRLAAAPDVIPRLRQFILDLAVRGKLVEQDPNDEPAFELLRRIEEEKEALSQAGTITTANPLLPVQSDDVPFALPNAWNLVQLSFISEKITDGEHATPPRVEEQQVPLVTAKNVRDGLMDYSDTDWVTYQTAEMAWKRCRPEVGDILLVCVGATTGRLCVLREAKPMVLVRSVALIRPSKSLDVEYLAASIRSPMCQAQIWDKVKASAQPCLYINRINSLIIPIPPVPEQHRIVAKVDELMALCDRLEAAHVEREKRRDRLAAASLNRLNDGADTHAIREHVRFHLLHLPRLTTRREHIQQLRQTIFNLAVRGQLVPQDPNEEPASELLNRVQIERRETTGTQTPSLNVQADRVLFQIPPTWTWVRFGWLILRADSGWSPRCEAFPRSGDNWGVIKVSAVSWEKFLPAENKQMLPGIAPPNGAQINKGDFLISRANTSELVAKCVFVEEQPHNLILSDKIVRLQLTKNCNPKYLAIVNNHALHARTHYASEASGTSLSMKNVSRQVIYALPIPLPPLAEQDRIVAQVDRMMALCDRLEAQLTVSETESRRLLESVLHEALLKKEGKARSAAIGNMAREQKRALEG